MFQPELGSIDKYFYVITFILSLLATHPVYILGQFSIFHLQQIPYVFECVQYPILTQCFEGAYNLSFFTSINTVFSLTLGKHIGSFTGKEIIQYQIFSYFSIHFLPTSLVQFFLLFLFLFSIVFFLGRVCIRYILVKVNDTQNCFSNKNKSLYNERFRNDVV